MYTVDDLKFAWRELRLALMAGDFESAKRWHNRITEIETELIVMTGENVAQVAWDN